MIEAAPSHIPAAPVDVYLALGANLGDRRAQLDAAVAALGAVPGIEVVAVSKLRETAPVGGPPQGDYLNGAVRLRTRLAPATLLEICQALERDAGRASGGPRNAPRPLDLDLLLYDELRIDAPRLTVPHPRLLEREFVLEPLRELGVDVDELPRPRPRPEVLRASEAFRDWCALRRRSGCTLGLVPTMGALHAGHAALLEQARAACDRVAATIFVNPLQFGDGEDLARYPRTFGADLAVCRRAGVDVVFAPSVDGMYPPGFCSHIAVGAEAESMEGARRPGHFAGVVTVVARLWSLAQPDRAYFGRKDAQQVAVLRRLHADLGLSGELVECDTVREPDGLALSSRNVHLDAGDRAAAPVLQRALVAAAAAFDAGERDAASLLRTARRVLDAEPRARVEYLELRRGGDLGPLPPGAVPAGARLLVAARFGEPPTRLLDNVVLGAGGGAG